MMDISDRAQEILEKYWIRNKEKHDEWKMEIVSDNPAAEELVRLDHAKVDGTYLELTKKGWGEAKGCIRRHRLAERLLADVFDIKKKELHELGCKFEHALQKDVEENICILLGHPHACPHGRPIPEGTCCIENKRSPRRLILPLSECEVKDKVRIAYIRTHDEQVMNKLISMGILPGLDIELLRKTPSYLFQMGESQFAIDRTLAEKIQVRLPGNNTLREYQHLHHAEEGSPRGRDRGKGRGWGRKLRLRLRKRQKG